MTEKSGENKKAQAKEEREDRLKAALRANLRRRKAASRKAQSTDESKE